MKKLCGIVLMAVLLAGCVDEEAMEFIDQESTRAAAQEMTVEAMKQEGLAISVEDIDYEHGGKQIDTSVIVVDYLTLHEPAYRGRAFLNVDTEATPRKLVGIDHLGLAYTDGLVPIGKMLIEHLKGKAHQSMIPDVEKVIESVPGLSWDEAEEKINFKRVEYREEKLQDLLRLYGEDRLANPSEDEAKQWESQFEKPSTNANEPVIWLNFFYDGEMTNSNFEEVLQKFAEAEQLPKGTYTIRITADRFDETEEPQFNERSNGEGSEVFIGTLTTSN